MGVGGSTPPFKQPVGPQSRCETFPKLDGTFSLDGWGVWAPPPPWNEAFGLSSAQRNPLVRPVPVPVPVPLF